MDLICSNEKCRRSFKNIDVFKGWDDRKMKAALAMANGDKANLRKQQEDATELNTTCPDCGSKMSRTDQPNEIVETIAEKMAKKMKNQAARDDIHRELGDLDQFGEENWDDVQRRRVKELEAWLEEIEDDDQ